MDDRVLGYMRFAGDPDADLDTVLVEATDHHAVIDRGPDVHVIRIPFADGLPRLREALSALDVDDLPEASVGEVFDSLDEIEHARTTLLSSLVETATDGDTTRTNRLDLGHGRVVECDSIKASKHVVPIQREFLLLCTAASLFQQIDRSSVEYGETVEYDDYLSATLTDENVLPFAGLVPMLSRQHLFLPISFELDEADEITLP